MRALPYLRQCYVLSSFLMALLPAVVKAQVGYPEITTLEATVVEVVVKGRKSTIVVETADEPRWEIPLTAKIEFGIVSSGTIDALKEGVLLRGEGVVSNESLFAGALSVYPQYEGRPVPFQVVKAPPQVGASQARQLFTGVLVSRAKDSNSDYEILQMKLAGTRTAPIYLQKAARINLVQTEPQRVKAGAKIKIEGRQIGKRFQVSRLTIESEQ